MKRFIPTLSVLGFLLGALLIGFSAGSLIEHVHAQASHGFITYADITGSGSNTQVDTTAGHACRWIQIVTPSTNSATLVRWGDTTISATQGGTIAAGGGQFLPPIASSTGDQFYDVTKLFVRAASNDKVSVVCGQ